MNELLNVNNDTQTVSARSIYESLEVQKRFSVWFETNSQGFIEGEDFTSVPTSTVVNNGAVRQLEDYQVSIDMAKHICLMSRTENGKQCRQYLIDLEKAWNTPEQIMARALDIAHQTINNLKIEVNAMKPKAAYFDALVDRKLNVSFTDCAKELGIQRKEFIKFLRDNGYIFKGNDGNYRPYSQYAEHDRGYFVVKDVKIDNGYATVQTLVTPKGKEVFNMLINQLSFSF